MSNSTFGILSAVAVVSLAVVVTVQQHSRARLEAQNEALLRQLSQFGRVTAENERLSNVVAQASAAQASVNAQFQELLKLRSEVARLHQEQESTNQLTQAKIAESVTEQLRELAALREEMAALGDSISLLRDDLQTAQSTTPAANADERTTAGPNSTETGPPAIRTIETHDAFAEKLKRVAAAQDGETFQDVFSRFLQLRGVNPTSVAGAYFDERTGRVLVRAPRTVLDQVEQVTVALDRSQ